MSSTSTRRRSSATIDLDDCIQISNTTKQCLELRRQINAIRNKREVAQIQFAQLESNYNARIMSASHRLDRITQFNNDEYLIDHIRAAKPLFNKDAIILSPYILQKQAELIKEVRKQELLEIYTRVMEEQNNELISDMERVRLNMIEGLKFQEKEVESIREKLYRIVIDRVKSYGHSREEKTYRMNYSNLAPIGQQTLNRSRQLSFSKRRHISGIPSENNSRVQLYEKSYKKNMQVNNAVRRSLNCADQVFRSPLKQHRVTRISSRNYSRIR